MGIFRKPSEPSAAGFMLLSSISGLIAAKASVIEFAVGLILLLLHLFTFDTVLLEARKNNYRRALLVLGLNAIPYVVGVAFSASLIMIVLVSLIVILLHMLLVIELKWRNPWVYITGSVIPVLPGLTIPTLVTLKLDPNILLIWIMMTIYVAASSAYIESKLPYRTFNPLAALLIWILTYPAIIVKPLIVIGLIEPTIKYLLNVINPTKLGNNVEEIKRFGWNELFRFIFYTIIILVIILWK